MASGQAACPIWGTPATVLGNGGDWVQVRSPRAGGEYKISGSAQATVRYKSPAEKARITTWIIDQRRSGEAVPFVTDDLVQRASARRPLKISQRKQRFLLLALSRGLQPSDAFKLAGTNNDKYQQDTGDLAAWTECSSPQEMQGIVRLLTEEGIVTNTPMGEMLLTAKGFERMDALESGAASTNQAFVAMWFDPTMTSVFDDGFDLAIRDAGYTAFRIDRKEHGNKVDDEIVAEIRRSRFVVADFTCGLFDVNGKSVAAARGGVYYEAGFAQGLGIPVIWSCRADCIEHVHFDTRQFNHIVWDNPADLRPKLLNRIRAVIV